MGPLCEKHDCTVGEVVESHADELRGVVAEFQAFGRIEFSVHPKVDYLLDRIVDYSRSIPTYRAGVKEWRWRNGAVLDAVLDREMRMPAHVRLLMDAGHADEIPDSLLIRG